MRRGDRYIGYLPLIKNGEHSAVSDYLSVKQNGKTYSALAKQKLKTLLAPRLAEAFSLKQSGALEHIGTEPYRLRHYQYPKMPLSESSSSIQD
jgi:hypothetical protein